MKKFLLLIVLFLAMSDVYSQSASDIFNVTFRVSLKGSGRKLNSDGIRITGALGSPDQKDWDPPTALNMNLAQPASDSIFFQTIRVKRSANDTIEFKFINGKTWGDGTSVADNLTEDERGVTSPCIIAGGGFGNRFFSTKGKKNGDNIVLPVYVFNTCKAATATAGAVDVFNVTFRVTLKGSGRKLNSDGIRITGALGSTNQTDWDPPTAKNMKIGTPTTDSIFSTTLTVSRPTNDTVEYKFINGKTWGDGTSAADNLTEDERGVTAPCIKASSGFGNRFFSTKGLANYANIILPAYIFNQCKTIAATGTNDLTTVAALNIAPNPAFDRTVLSFTNLNNVNHTLRVVSVTGQVVRAYAATTSEQFIIETSNLTKGLYFARLSNEQGESSTLKFVVE